MIVLLDVWVANIIEELGSMVANSQQLQQEFKKKNPFIQQKSTVCVKNAVKYVVLSWKR